MLTVDVAVCFACNNKLITTSFLTVLAFLSDFAIHGHNNICLLLFTLPLSTKYTPLTLFLFIKLRN